jgi:small subunit ribosomal protein S21
VDTSPETEPPEAPPRPEPNVPPPRTADTHTPVLGRPLEVRVDDRGVERAIRKLRRLMASEGVLRELKRRRHYEKPSVRLKRKIREAERRRKRRERKRTFGALG